MSETVQDKDIAHRPSYNGKLTGN